MKKPSSPALFIVTLAAFACSLSLSASPAAAAPSPQHASASTSTGASKSSASSTKKKKTRRRSSKREPFQKAPTPDRISEIQSALARGGYYQGEPNGKWDSNTVAALEKFQSDNGMNASGKLDAPSLQKLGLGSSTAGVDAPRPPSHTSPAMSSAPASSANSASVSTAPVSAGTSSANAANSSSATAKPPQR